jgi:hypothetical protein
MGVHPWPGIDPATAYLTMTSGPGAAPMHVYSAAMTTHAGAIHAMVATSAVNTVATGEVWQGSGSVKAAAAVTTLSGDDVAQAESALLKAELAQAAGELHTMTAARMVTHVQANANRMEYVADNAINPWVLGALTARLGELDTEYFGFMWPNNAQAGVSYGAGLDGLGAALAALSALPTMAGGSVAAPAMAAADVAANAGISMASAVMSTAEQAAMAAVSPAAAAPQAASGLLGQAPLSAPATSTNAATVSPMANVQTHAPAMPSLAQAQAPAMGMFTQPPTAAVSPPTPPTITAAPPVQTLTPATGPGAAPPGVTSFVKPATPFTAPPTPSGGQAAGLNPGMLNAAALRGPVTTVPATNAVLTEPLTTSSLATATQPLAYVPPTPPPPTPAPPSQALLEPGTIQTLQPPPTPPPTTPPPAPTPPPAVPQTSPPASATGPTGAGTNGTGIQMLGTGPPGAPQAPAFPPIPLDPSPPVPQPPVPPPPSPGDPPLTSPPIPSWVTPPVSKTVESLQKAYKDLNDAIKVHNSWRPDPNNPGAVDSYNREAWTYNTWKAQIEDRLGSENVQYTPTKEAVSTDNRYWWTRPAPEQQVHQGPLTQNPDELRLSQESVIDKLWRYLLDPDHSSGGPKANWFEQALGFTRQNLPVLARQISFDPSKAWETGVTEYGMKYNQVISITGANGRIIDVLFGWIRGPDGVAKLVTAIPTGK